MDTTVKIILIAACVCLADCRLHGKFHKNLSSTLEHSQTQVNTNTDADHKVIAIKKNDVDHLVHPEVKTDHDADAIVFPSDDDKVHLNANKIVSKIPDPIDASKHVNELDSIHNNNKAVPVPLISKVVPATEAKEVFTNPIVFKDKKEAAVGNKTNIQTRPEQIEDTTEIKTAIDNTVARNENITQDNTESEVKSNNTLNSNATAPDFSSRFGGTGNYMLVPVNNAQTYQPVQTVPNPVSNIQGASPSYLVNYDHSNTIPVVTNVNTQHAMPGFASNIGTNPQYITAISNAMYTTPNANPIVANNANPIVYNSNQGVSQGHNNYVPLNVPNTYVINGQLYAAVTVPNNVNVPDSLYFAISQSGYQVANNMPLYKLVTVDQAGNQVLNNAQFGQ